MIWNIVVDTSCNFTDLHYNDGVNEIRYHSVPFVISVENRDYVDDENLNIDAMLGDMESVKTASRTGCPSPQAYLEKYMLEGNVIVVTISSNLSGSHNSAVAALDMYREHYGEKNIALIDSFSAGAGQDIIVENLMENIKAGKSFDEVVAEAEELNRGKRTIFTLCSFDNLVRNGRMSPIVGFVAQKLGFWGIGVASEIGTIIIKGKCRGSAKAVRAVVEDFKSYRPHIRKVYISHCQNEEVALRMKEEILAVSPDTDVVILPTRGLCSYYAERKGLILAYL